MMNNEAEVRSRSAGYDTIYDIVFLSVCHGASMGDLRTLRRSIMLIVKLSNTKACMLKALPEVRKDIVIHSDRARRRHVVAGGCGVNTIHPNLCRSYIQIYVKHWTSIVTCC